MSDSLLSLPVGFLPCSFQPQVLGIQWVINKYLMALPLVLPSNSLGPLCFPGPFSSLTPSRMFWDLVEEGLTSPTAPPPPKP